MAISSPSTANPEPIGEEKTTNVKRHAIVQACRDHDVLRLAELADTPGGLLEDELRKSAWPILLDVTQADYLAAESATSWRTLPPHPEEEQVQKDVDRAFVYYPDEGERTLSSRKTLLYDLIVRILRTYRLLSYFQGYHDIIQVLLLVLGKDKAFPAAARLSLFRIRDYMLPTLAPAVKHLQLIPEILALADAELARHICQVQPFFALGATLTMYAHDIEQYGDIARLFDFILAHEPVITFYLFASTVIRRRSKLLLVDPMEEPEMIQFILSKIPQPLDLQGIVDDTLLLFHRYPPQKLHGRAWSRISSSSVLKTSRDLTQRQTEAEGKRLFQIQQRELVREERLKRGLAAIARNRAPLLTLSTALLVGAVSVWLRRSGHDRTLLAAFAHITTHIWRNR